MKISLEKALPFIFTLSLYVASYSVFQQAVEFNNKFGDVYFSCHPFDTWNNWHYAGIAFLIFAFGCTIGLIVWLLQNDNNDEE